MSFNIYFNDKETNARIGKLKTSHGEIETPFFMPVGTYGAVKSLCPEDLKNKVKTDIILSNTYHLYLRPGLEVIKKFSGLHKFINWDRIILTDSGGFQVYSLTKLLKKSDDGVEFQSHIDGSKHFFTPEKVIKIQETLNSDIMMIFDDCVEYGANEEDYILAMKRTTNWAKRCKNIKKNQNLLFGIIQGGFSENFRQNHLEEIVNIGFDGYAIGGLSVGEPKEEMYRIIEFITPKMPDDKPRYLMGVGKPEDILFAVENGVDMFDCVLPTRNARNGTLFTSIGPINIKKQEYKFKDEPLDANCNCYTCKNFSKAYLRHLFTSKELLSYRLNTIHNLTFYINLMKDIKKSIKNNNFLKFKKDFLSKYCSL